MTYCFVPVITCENNSKYYTQMALKTETDCEVDLQENSLDDSIRCEEEYLVDEMVDDRSIGSSDGRHQLLAARHFMESNDGDSNQMYAFQEDLGAVTYKIVQMPSNSITSISSNSSMPTNAEYFVIGDTVSVQQSGTQKKAIRKNPVEAKVVASKKRDDKRRATHNEVERRRRDKINSWISKLSALVPNSAVPDGASFSASKGGILAKACDYINELTEKQKRLEHVEADYEKLALEVVKLKHEVLELRKENVSMRHQLVDNCIVNQRLKSAKS